MNVSRRSRLILFTGPAAQVVVIAEGIELLMTYLPGLGVGRCGSGSRGPTAAGRPTWKTSTGIR